MSEVDSYKPMIPSFVDEYSVRFFDEDDCVKVWFKMHIPRYNHVFDALIEENDGRRTYYTTDVISDHLFEFLLENLKEEHEIPTVDPLRLRFYEVGMSRLGIELEKDNVPAQILNFRMHFRFMKPHAIEGNGISQEYLMELGAESDFEGLEDFESRPNGRWEGSPECPVMDCEERVSSESELYDHCVGEHGFWEDEFEGVFG